jgi:predicted RNase H-like HicB family nuclease
LEVKYAVVYEPTPTGYSAFVPDLPGYAAAARTVDELRLLVREGIPFHLDGLREAGGPVPPPAVVVDTVEVA